MANVAYHSTMDYASFFQDLDQLDKSSIPHHCHGGASTGPVLAERKERRLASNRASARRSRMRKRRHLDALSSQAAGLRAMNQRLAVEMNRVIAEHSRMLQENARLREEARVLQKRLDEIGG